MLTRYGRVWGTGYWVQRTWTASCGVNAAWSCSCYHTCQIRLTEIGLTVTKTERQRARPEATAGSATPAIKLEPRRAPSHAVGCNCFHLCYQRAPNQQFEPASYRLRLSSGVSLAHATSQPPVTASPTRSAQRDPLHMHGHRRQLVRVSRPSPPGPPHPRWIVGLHCSAAWASAARNQPLLGGPALKSPSAMTVLQK